MSGYKKRKNWSKLICCSKSEEWRGETKRWVQIFCQRNWDNSDNKTRGMAGTGNIMVSEEQELVGCGQLSSRSQWGSDFFVTHRAACWSLGVTHHIYKHSLTAQHCGAEQRCWIYLLSHHPQLWRLVTESSCWIGITSQCFPLLKRGKWLRQNK